MFTVPIIFAVFAAIMIVLSLINSLIVEPIASHVRKKAAEEQALNAWMERQAEQRKAREKAAAAKSIAAQAAAAKKHEAAMKKALAERRRNEREQKQAAAHAVKVARATELAELAERRLKAERERQALKAAAKPAAKVAAPAPVNAGSSSNVIGNNMFRNEVVSFTGTLPGMTRKEAIAAVEANGGKAYETMPVSTTLLVVGDNPGNGKLDKADMWRTRKITAKQFNTMCNVRVMVN